MAIQGRRPHSRCARYDGWSALHRRLDGHFYALDAKTGTLRWSFKTQGPIYSSPRAAYDLIHFGSLDGNVYALESQTGRVKWQFKTRGPVTHHPRHSKISYISEAWTATSTQSKRTAVAWSGALTQKSPYRAPEQSIPVPSFSATWAEKFFAVSSKTGVEKWHAKADGKITCSPALGFGRAQFGTHHGSLYSVDMMTGQEKWVFKSEGPCGGISFSGVWILSFGSCDGNLYVLDFSRGQLRWKFKTGAAVYSSPVVADGVIYFGSDDGSFYVLH